ncbi:MAG: adenosine-specific kinase [Bryobacterales bacterium]|nr:adenosine-specific kinase [Bryobacterales bacterium]
MELKLIPLAIPDGANLILGQSHFIKTVEDVYEAVVNTNPAIRFGVAFNEASGPCLVRHDGNDGSLREAAVAAAQAIGAGHIFVLFLREGFPINLTGRLKEVPEVAALFCATANPVQVVVADTEQGRGILGVIDGASPKGVEGEADIAARKEFLRKIGYKR